MPLIFAEMALFVCGLYSQLNYKRLSSKSKHEDKLDCFLDSK